MKAPSLDPWKLGLFVVIVLSTAVGLVFWLGARRLSREKIPAVTYFNESVQGLDVGAPIKIRGVTIGAVRAITIAPDHRMVEVHMDLYADVLERLGLRSLGARPVLDEEGKPSDLRLQLATSGITGVKFIEADFFDPRTNPVVQLGFPPGANYVPSTPSTLKSIGDAVTVLAEVVPEAAGEVSALVKSLRSMIEELDAPGLSRRSAALLEEASAQLAALELGALRSRVEALLVELEGTLAGTNALLADTRGSLARVQELLAQVDAPDGTLARVAAQLEETLAELDRGIEAAELGATSAALRDGSRGVEQLVFEATAAAQELRVTLEGAREALEAFRALSTTLERDPASLLRGRAPVEDVSPLDQRQP